MNVRTLIHSTALTPILVLTFLFLCLSGKAQIAPAQIFNDTRSFEVTACQPSKRYIITAWMEKRPIRKDNDENAADMRVAYKSSLNNGKDWNEKAIIDLPETFATGNPYLTSNDRGNVYLVCMHIGRDFFSGNISLYEFDFAKRKFELKSVPIKSTDRLLDKPSVVSYGNEIHLTYVSYSQRFTNSVKYQMSKDNGKTWTDAVDVFRDSTVRYLGPSIALTSQKQVVISAGSYGRKNIFLVKKKRAADSLVFETPLVVSKVSDKLGSAMTELSRSNNKLLLTWQNPHQRSETWLSFSGDDGNTWAEPRLINEKGNLLSAVSDSRGHLHCIYSDFGNQHFSVSYRCFNEKYEVLKESYLMKPVPLSHFNEYLGAYQKLMISDNKLYAFWINYRDNSTLNFTTWFF